MGMFDYLKCQAAIPGCTDCSKEEFQTKSFDNVMGNYVITAKGELYEEKWEYEWVDDPGYILKGYIKQVEGTYTRNYLTDFHGDIIFYTSKPMDENRTWRDYHARFTEGKLTRIWYKDTKY